MARDLRRSRGRLFDPWPGYVDALSTLLMVIIFVLLVFVLAQAFLSVALTGRDRALDRLNRQVAEISDLLALERAGAADLRQTLSRLNTDLGAALGARDDLSRQLAALGAERDRIATDRDATRADRDRLIAQLADTGAQAGATAARIARLEAQLAEAQARGDTQGSEIERAARDLGEARRRIAAVEAERDQQAAALDATRRDLAATRSALQAVETRSTAQLSDLQRATAELDAARAAILAAQARARALEEANAALDREVTVGRETIQARLAELARLQQQMQALTALRDELERQAQDAAARQLSEAERRAAVEAQLTQERTLSESARAQVALLNRNLAEIRSQLAALGAALEAAEAGTRDRDAQIANLGARLNTALAARVEELQRYRSDFFGRLRDALGSRPGITIVGDRFVIQSEVLFAVGSSELQSEGAERIRELAVQLREITASIPPEVSWILRVDGHADNSPIRGGGFFATNWELSAARAVTVVRLLIAFGIPPERLAATGFGEFQPVDPADTAAARARNRRIEFRLTDR
jgi:chemotaxis protein MotB